MIGAMFHSDAALALMRAVAVSPVEAPDPEAEDGFPAAVVDWLARLRLLWGVPFAYLVPDEALLPRESIRFFYVNRNWTDAAVDGALSVGAATTRDRARLEALHAELRDAVDRHERKVRAKDADQPLMQGGSGEVVTGLLLRSRAVSGWPALHVRASRGGHEVQLVRMERLAPAVLLALIDGVPDRVEIEEPRAGIQFGVEDPKGDRPADSRWLVVRDPATGEPAEVDGERVPDVRVPFRAGSPGVIDMTELKRRLQGTVAAGPDGALGAGEMALQLLQFPFQQIFGAPAGGIGKVFRVTIEPGELRRRLHLEA
jgi:hypothetical protein